MTRFRTIPPVLGAALLAGAMLTILAGCGPKAGDSGPYTGGSPSAKAPAAPGGPPGSGVPGGPSSNK